MYVLDAAHCTSKIFKFSNNKIVFEGEFFSISVHYKDQHSSTDFFVYHVSYALVSPAGRNIVYPMICLMYF